MLSHRGWWWWCRGNFKRKSCHLFFTFN